MPLKIEPWPGGRWYRDLGDNNGHLWGHVQASKRPRLLETAAWILSGAISTAVIVRAWRAKRATTNMEQKTLTTATTDKLNGKVVSPADWLKARKDLLAKEKEFTRLRDDLSRQGRELPWEKLQKHHVFDGPKGKVTLADLVRRSQPAHRLSLYVRSGMERRVPELLVPG
jgi:hypothetical protein